MIPKYRAWNSETKEIEVFKTYEEISELFLALSADDGFYSIMQSTGLKDKNGKEVFEGDVVKCNGLLGTIESFKAMWICSFVKYNNYQKVGFFAQEIEVVGNIYENPELLEDKE